MYKGVTDDIEPGETARVNHDECLAGEDTRRRLYLTRPNANPDTIIAYCHNCQAAGYLSTGTHTAYRDDQHKGKAIHYTKDIVQADFGPPPGMISDPEMWPTHALGWMYKNKCNSKIMEAYGIQYDPSSDRVFIPRHKQTTKQFCHNLQAYQLRNTDAKKDVPKYLTVCSEDDNGHTIMYGECDSSMPSPLVVIVEDYLSGIAITEAYHRNKLTVHAMVNYGTKVSIEMLHHVARYDNVLVWLDNDSAHVIEQAQHMARTVGMMNAKCDVQVHTTTNDPKYHSYDHIRTEIESRKWGV